MRKMTSDQARNYILSGYFPEKPAEHGSMNYNPALEYAYIKELAELRNVFNMFPTTFCASLLADEQYRGNAQELFSMIWDDLDVTVLNMIAYRIVEARERIERLHDREFQLECELNDIRQKLKHAKEEHVSLTAES